ncbi:phage tail protein [Profundibacterium mesophilum]|uniref:Phage tail protein U n=1 Tax=Profundibacterium mesophilum KAUST100406-0324 TaxID=1037889 RepID=A0A921TDV6_9RHOB|nr:phage tail protein [Profundibacterium mesophilum]KAF0676726.1 putative phage tail protein U [Profundibacterium mesophilum KAUST100406-0324]
MRDLVMMALGAFRFGIFNGGYQSFRREAAYRWEALERIGRAPAHQFTGPGVQTITLEGVIYPHFRGGLRQIDLMRAQAQLGLPLMLVDGAGFVWRRWVITQVSETRTALLADGAPRKIAFSITLAAYGEDAA